ncbi:hypothetical protein RDV89_13285 [Nocardioides zeae]|uniref:DUF559 domain-containing protein n=1 Tax=Nocardioides imazamoxiresistens TaxID=3231893 RepID=A0ABU3PXT9_9ACTN|nr:hypothetical protein [Nocardioides zeae]MDT9594050.1 hypothetical protein [Nocardioides zeae]
MSLAPPDDRRRARREPWRVDLDRLAGDQAGVVSRQQLRHLGVHREEVRRRVALRQWTARTPNVVGLTTGVPDVLQRRWTGVLHPPGDAALAGRTALEVHGVRGWESPLVCVVVPVGQHHPVAGFEWVRTRRPFVAWTVRKDGLPTLRVEPAALLLASRLTHPRSAVGVVAACVQQRRTTAEALRVWLDRLQPLPRTKLLTAVLEDIAGGAQSVAEIDLGHVCRRAGLAPPARQRRRRDSAGRRRWTDAEWDLPDGVVLVLEVDGAFHMEATAWTDDKRRHRRLTSRHRIVIGCTALELRVAPDDVARDLAAHGVPRA